MGPNIFKRTFDQRIYCKRILFSLAGFHVFWPQANIARMVPFLATDAQVYKMMTANNRNGLGPVWHKQSGMSPFSV
jgi:hypothetical protein